MKFGFIAHARGVRELRTIFLLRHDISSTPFRSGEVVKSKALEEGLIRDIFTYRKIYSPQQISCSFSYPRAAAGESDKGCRSGGSSMLPSKRVGC